MNGPSGSPLPVEAAENPLVRRTENIGLDERILGFEGGGQYPGKLGFHESVENHPAFFLCPVDQRHRPRTASAPYDRLRALDNINRQKIEIPLFIPTSVL